MSAPLKNETQVPNNEENDDGGGGDKRAVSGTEEFRKALKQQSQAENEDGRERNKKAISKRSYPVPIGITGNNVVEPRGREGKKQRKGSGRAGGKKQSHDSKAQNRGPADHTL